MVFVLFILIILEVSWSLTYNFGMLYILAPNIPIAVKYAFIFHATLQFDFQLRYSIGTKISA